MDQPANHPHVSHPIFIVLEGVDGSGKSTQAQFLADWLREKGAAVRLTREPGGSALAERLRELILDQNIKCSPRAELLMLLAARAQHVSEVIEPALLAGETVISDRFSLSTYAYQGYGRGLSLEEIRYADEVATGGVCPTLTILLDVSLSSALSRIGERKDRFEGEGKVFLQKVIDGYRQLAAGSPGMRIVDGTLTVEEVQEAIRREVNPLLAGG